MIKMGNKLPDEIRPYSGELKVGMRVTYRQNNDRSGVVTGVYSNSAEIGGWGISRNRTTGVWGADCDDGELGVFEERIKNWKERIQSNASK